MELLSSYRKLNLPNCCLKDQWFVQCLLIQMVFLTGQRIMLNLQVSSKNVRNSAVWSCRSSLTCKIWATAFPSVILDWWKSFVQLDKKRKHFPFILILSFLTSIWPHTFDIDHSFQDYSTLQPLIFPHLNPMDYRETQIIINANFSTLTFWVWINHSVPTFDRWPFITHPNP